MGNENFGDMINRFIWWDTETSGTGPEDQIVQLAAIITDKDFNIIEEHDIHCQMREDVIPHPMATLTHQISIADANSMGEPEALFARRIEQLMTEEPNTCVLGYNTLKFDDARSRELFYRNGLDPYKREWANGNSRSDIFSLVRMVNVLRPDILEWPKNEDGSPSLALEKLAPLNGVKQERAHDALSDVYATIGVAKLIKDRHERMYNYFLGFSDKHRVAQLTHEEPFLYIGKGAEYEHKYATMLLPIGSHPKNKNSILCYDLRYDLDQMGDSDVEELRKRLYERRDNPDLPRAPFMQVAINQVPVVCPHKMVTPEVAERIGLDIDEVMRRAEQIRNDPELGNLTRRIERVFDSQPEIGPDAYSQIFAGFIGRPDRRRLDDLKPDNVKDWCEIALSCHDERQFDLAVRAVGNYNPQCLPEKIEGVGPVVSPAEEWRDWLERRWSDQEGRYGLTVPQFREALSEARQLEDLTEHKVALLDELESFIEERVARYAPELALEEPKQTREKKKISDFDDELGF